MKRSTVDCSGIFGYYKDMILEAEELDIMWIICAMHRAILIIQSTRRINKS